METSAKTAQNVQELFVEIAKKMPLDQIASKNARAAAGGSKNSGINLNQRIEQSNDGCAC